MVDKVKTIIGPGETVFLADKGTSLLNVLLRAGVPMQTACGGQGTCGKCRVSVQGVTALPDEKERHHLEESDLSRGIRLSCRLVLTEDVRVDLPADTGDLPLTVQDKPGPAGHSIFSKLAVAVDIGTTTIKMEVIGLPGGKVIAFNSAFNPQRAFGHDVMSRLYAARLQADYKEMTTLLRDSVTRMILQSLGKLNAFPGDVFRIVISGNTVMLHFFFGMDVSGLGKYPYTPQSLDAVIGKADSFGLDPFEKAEIIGLPAISAYLGGDLVAGLLSTGVHKTAQNSILIDIGTNSEMIFKGPKGLLATSCAAGPALEGMNIEYGMTASPGAISGIEILDHVKLNLIEGSGKPLGLCGSGIIQLMAELLRTGLVDRTGRMAPFNDSMPLAVLERLKLSREIPAFFLTPDVCFTQKDVRQVQLAKAAILSGQKTLREMAGVLPDEIGSVIIAGEFGRHLNPDLLVQLGLIEPLPHAEYSFVGNSSLRGAGMIAVNPELTVKAQKIAGRVEAFPLATLKGYERLFINSLEFPETA